MKLRASGMLIAERALRFGLGLVVGVLLARHLGAESYGLLGSAISLAWLMMGLSDMGLSSIFQHELELARAGERDRVLGSALALRALGGTVGWGVGVVAAWLMRHDDRTFLIVASLVLSINLSRTLELIELGFISDGRPGDAAGSRLMATVLGNGLRVWGIVAGFPLAFFAACVAIEGVLAGLGMLAVYRIRRTTWSGLEVAGGLVRSMLRRAWLPLLAGIASTAYLQIDQLMVLGLGGEHEAGVYAAAVRVSQCWFFIPNVLIAVAFPAMARAARDGNGELVPRTRRLWWSLATLSFVVALGATLVGDPLMDAAFGAEFSGAGAVLALHCWSALPICWVWASRSWLYIHRREGLLLPMSIVGLVANVVLNAILIPQHGAMGAAWATLAAALIRAGSLLAFRPGRAYLAALVGLPVGLAVVGGERGEDDR